LISSPTKFITNWSQSSNNF